MPELPEVETVRDGLARHLLGRTVTGVQVRRDSSVRRHEGGPLDFAGRLTGRTFTAAVRRGKFLWLLLDVPGEALMAHLGMSGQLLVRRQQPEVPVHAHLRTRIRLSNVDPAVLRVDTGRTGSADWAEAARASSDSVPVDLDFVDQRTFGHLMVTDLVPTPDGAPGGYGSELAALPEPAAHIARDPLDPALDRAALVRAVRRRRTDVKRALLDQTLVSGIGNIYADEALWRARLHWARPTSALRPIQVNRLLDAAEQVMRESLRAGGTTFDALYVDVNGSSGYFERSLAVYGRAGRPCPRCGTPVVRDAFMNRSSFTCPRCQPRPRLTRDPGGVA